MKVTGKTGEASFTFEIADAKPPAITGPVTANNLIAVLVSSLGSQARVVTNSGPLKLAVNGQPQGDAGPAGVDLKGFQPGVDEIVVGDGQGQRNMKESFGPAPMLTAFLKSDVNIGTLIVSTGEDDVQVFVNDKEYRRQTARAGAHPDDRQRERARRQGWFPERAATNRRSEKRRRSPAGIQAEAAAANDRACRFAERLRAPKYFSIRPASAPSARTGTSRYQTVSPGDHAIDLRRDSYTPKTLQRSFKAGQPMRFRAPM